MINFIKRMRSIILKGFFIDAYIILVKKMSTFRDDINFFFDDSYSADSDEQNSDGKIRMKRFEWKNSNVKI